MVATISKTLADTIRRTLAIPERTVPQSPVREGETSSVKQKLEFTEEEEGGVKESSSTGESGESTSGSEESHEKELAFKNFPLGISERGHAISKEEKELQLEEIERKKEKLRIETQRKLQKDADLERQKRLEEEEEYVRQRELQYRLEQEDEMRELEREYAEQQSEYLKLAIQTKEEESERAAWDSARYTETRDVVDRLERLRQQLRLPPLNIHGGIGECPEGETNPYESAAYRDFGAVFTTDLQEHFTHSYKTRANQFNLPPEPPWQLPKPKPRG